jgi:hypothetical protein
MANDLLEMARREADRLRAELAQNEIFQKLQIVQRMIEGYEAFESGVSRPKPLLVVRRAPVAARPQSKLAQVEDLVLAHTMGTGKRATSGQLLAIMNEAGVMMGGKVPSKTLSSMLSNSTRLNNVQGYGYGPKEWGDNPSGMPPIPDNKAPADLLSGASEITPGGDPLPGTGDKG